MKTINSWLDEYGASHKNATNKTIHWICVAIIYFSVIGLLAEIPVPKNFAGESNYLNFWNAWPDFQHYLLLSSIKTSQHRNSGLSCGYCRRTCIDART